MNIATAMQFYNTDFSGPVTITVKTRTGRKMVVVAVMHVGIMDQCVSFPVDMLLGLDNFSVTIKKFRKLWEREE